MPPPPQAHLVVDLGARPQTTAWITATLGGRRARPVWVRPLDVADPETLEEFYSEDWASIAVCARSYTVLRQSLWALPSFGRAARILIAVDEAPNLVRRLGPRRHAYPRLRSAVASDMDDEQAGPVTRLSFEFETPVSLDRVVVDHVGVGPQTFAAVPIGGVRVAVTDPRAARWVAGDPSARTPANAARTWFSDNPALPAFDVVLGGPTPAPSSAVDVTGQCPPVDVHVVNPHGFRSEIAVACASAVVTTVDDAVTVRVVRDEGTVVSFDVRHGLSTTQVARLRQLGYVDATQLAALPPAEHAGVLVQLAAAAVPVVVGDLPAPTRALMDPGLVACLEAVSAQTLSAPASRELAALRTRRAALATHSVAASRAGLSGSNGGLAPSPPVSALLVTRRPQLLAGALAGLKAQTHRNLEVVIAVHGADPPEGIEDLVGDFEHSVVLTEPGSTVFGAVLNRATAAASGEFVAKIDDDDWYGPHHIHDLLTALDWSGAHLVGCLDEFVYLAGQDVTIRRHDYARYEQVAGRVAGPTMLLRREDLRGFGGWRAAPSGVDLSLIHNIRDAGGVIYRTHGLGFMLCRHGRGHTWNPDDEQFLSSARERWDGFHPPAEIGDIEPARARLDALRSLAD